MNCLTGAHLLADRIGTKPAKEPTYVPDDAPALFHWCGVNPDAAPADDASPMAKPQLPVVVSSPARLLRLSAVVGSGA